MNNVAINKLHFYSCFSQLKSEKINNLHVETDKKCDTQ